MKFVRTRDVLRRHESGVSCLSVIESLRRSLCLLPSTFVLLVPPAQAIMHDGLDDDTQIAVAYYRIQHSMKPSLIERFAAVISPLARCSLALFFFSHNQTTCRMVRCPLPYMGGEQPGAPVNPNMPPVGEWIYILGCFGFSCLFFFFALV